MTTNRSHKDMGIDLANKREYGRKYYQANKARARKYYRANKEKIKERSMVWRVANRERYLKQQADYDLHRRVRDKEEKVWSDYRKEAKKRSDLRGQGCTTTRG